RDGVAVGNHDFVEGGLVYSGDGKRFGYVGGSGKQLPSLEGRYRENPFNGVRRALEYGPGVDKAKRFAVIDGVAGKAYDWVWGVGVGGGGVVGGGGGRMGEGGGGGWVGVARVDGGGGRAFPGGMEVPWLRGLVPMGLAFSRGGGHVAYAAWGGKAGMAVVVDD